MKSRVIEIFENSIDSKKTLDLYNFHLKKFAGDLSYKFEINNSDKNMVCMHFSPNL